MRTAEIYKLRTQRTPILCAAVLLIGVLAPSVVLIWYTPTDSAAYTDAWIGTFEALALVFAIVFGGWLLGTEYRQDTVKRVLTSEPRRLRALATKGVVGAVAMSTVFATSAGIGWMAARAVGSSHGVSVPWDGRSVLAFIVTALIPFTVAYSLSAITKSDSFAMVGTVAMVFVFEPLISLIPRVGDYTIGRGMASFEQAMTGEVDDFATLSAGAATVTLVVWLAALVTSAAALFATRDV